MLNNLYQKLSLAVTCTILGVTAIEIQPIQAVTYRFESTMIEGLFLEGARSIDLEPNPDLYDGSFTFDDSSLTGVGFESFGVAEGLTVSLFDDSRVNQDIDVRFPGFPKVNFQDGKLLGLDWFAVYHPFTNVPELDYPGDFIRISGKEFTDGFDPTFYTPEDELRSPVLGFGTVEYTRVPEPGTILGLAIVTLGVGLLRRKKDDSL
ncbi:MAG: PEP-CTERM sorting domain-containing protein, partial [Cyanobacteria bacterium P01_A01_bin.68]